MSNKIAEEINDYLMHYGMPRRSGRYPYGSGEDPYQHGNRDLLGRIEELKKSGWTETAENVRKEFKMSLRDYRQEKSWAIYERDSYRIEKAKMLRDKEGKGATEIGKIMGVNESTVRGWLNEQRETRLNQAKNTADFLKKQVDEKGMIDVGKNTELELGITRTQLDKALKRLEMEGYPTFENGIPQPTNPGQQTIQKVLCPPGSKLKDLYNYGDIHTITDYKSDDNGQTFEKKFVYPKSMDSKRLKILLNEEVGPDGTRGVDKDGIIEIRPGVEDLSLGKDRYAQVRILVDGNKYLKGVAVYSDNLPKGVDVLFNSNKRDYAKALKDISTDDPENPFGSLIKEGGQSYYIDKDGKKQLSLINKTRGEGDWSEWTNALPSQFLAKQNMNLIKKQLNLAKIDKANEYEDICSITNPTVKKYYLEKFADGCDAAAVDLKAAALPGQKYHVIIPINTLKDNEVYAPGYADGTQLALIRYPHAGTFEIPILKVNNKNALGKKIIGSDAIDAVGINKANADRLSGADFDGDTVMAIPTNDKYGRVKITNRRPLKDLEGFEPKDEYAAAYTTKDSNGVTHYFGKDGREYKVMKNKGNEMGVITNLITDMTIAGADDNELARAVKHSMVVIDAEKHHLDYKRSEIENNIAALKRKYQPKYDEEGNFVGGGGASTIFSKSKSVEYVPKRQGSYKINTKDKYYYDPTKPEGAKLYKSADDLWRAEATRDKNTGFVTLKTIDGKKVTYNPKDADARAKYSPIKRVDPETKDIYFTNRDGTIRYKPKMSEQKSTKMAETDDANALVSKAKNPKELAYAEYANTMKAMANRARKEYLATKEMEVNDSAKKVYAEEIKSLKAKLTTALLNSTRERAALRQANAEIREITDKNPNIKTKDLKKLKQRATTKARQDVGSVSRKERNIKITDKEWEAIQAGAINKSTLRSILNNTDVDNLRDRAMPRSSTTLSKTKINTIKAMSASNFTLAQIAEKLNVSTATVAKYLKGGN